MARYTNYDDLLKKWHDLGLDEISKIHKVNAFNHFIKSLPIADVEEVKRGEWKDRYGNKYYNQLYECSVCGREALYEFYTNELDQWETRQALTVGCPYCLAKMDGGNAE